MRTIILSRTIYGVTISLCAEMYKDLEIGRYITVAGEKTAYSPTIKRFNELTSLPKSAYETFKASRSV